MSVIVCAGWVPANDENARRECGGSTYNRRRADPAIVNVEGASCGRCRKQKAKYDEEHGAKERRELAERERYTARMELYAGDVREIIGLEDLSGVDLATLLQTVDALRGRDTWEPYYVVQHRRYPHEQTDLSSGDRLNVLRLLAGEDLVFPRGGYMR